MTRQSELPGGERKRPASLLLDYLQSNELDVASQSVH